MAIGVDTDKANESIKEGYNALERFGTKRWRNLGILALCVVVFSIYAVAKDGFKLFFQRIVDALNNGFIYAAMALALVLIYKATGVVNFAQGNMAMFGTFIAFVFISDHGFPIWLGIILAMFLSALGGAAIERVFIRPFDPSNHLAITIVTLAWFIMLGGAATVIWGADPYGFDTPFPRNSYFDFLGARFFYENLGTLGHDPRDAAASCRCCSRRPRSASPSGRCRRTSSPAVSSASTSAALSSSAGPWPPPSARWPAASSPTSRT